MVLLYKVYLYIYFWNTELVISENGSFCWKGDEAANSYSFLSLPLCFHPLPSPSWHSKQDIIYPATDRQGWLQAGPGSKISKRLIASAFSLYIEHPRRYKEMWENSQFACPTFSRLKWLTVYALPKHTPKAWSWHCRKGATKRFGTNKDSAMATFFILSLPWY